MPSTNQTVDGLDRGLRTLAPLDCDDPAVPFKVATAIEALAPLTRALRSTELRYVARYGKKDEAGNVQRDDRGAFLLDNAVEFSKAMDALYTQEVTLPALPQLTFDDLRALGVKASAELLLQLRPILCVPT